MTNKNTHQYCKKCELWRPKPFVSVVDRLGRKVRVCTLCGIDIKADRELRQRLEKEV